jgi:hypothetical protein
MMGILAIGVFSMILSCGSKSGTGTGNESFGHLSMALNVCTAPLYDVAGVQVKIFKVSDTKQDCIKDVADFEKTTSLICIPDTIADALFVLPAGDYKVCAIPVKDLTSNTQSDICSPVFLSPVSVVAEVVNEITLTSLCSNPNGGLDVITQFKDLVLITGLTIEPSKFITTCDTATITITVDDPKVVNTYDWTITLSPLGSNPKLTKLDPPWSAEFTTDMAGEYQVQVEVTNPAGNKTSLKEIPIHVRVCCENDGDCVNSTQGKFCCKNICKASCPDCGDGVVTLPETCDKLITCPATGCCSCDDGDVCTKDTVKSGDPSTCDLVCNHDSITACVSGDGCCPKDTAGIFLCNIGNDIDCIARCGDGIVTKPTETCDTGITCPAAGCCPTTCDDGVDCTKDTSSGSAAKCDLVCTNDPITECVGGDGCCNTTYCSGVQGTSNFDPNCIVSPAP